MNFKPLVLLCVAFCVSLAVDTSSAEAQLFRRGSIFSALNTAPTPAPTYRPSTPRPVSGYGSNFHRNFVIRQEQQRYARTGLPPRTRGNIYWGRWGR